VFWGCGRNDTLRHKLCTNIASAWSAVYTALLVGELATRGGLAEVFCKMQSQSVKSALLALVLFGIAAPGAEAQEAGLGAASPGGLGSPGAGPEGVGLAAYAANAPRADQGLVLGRWLVYPSFFGGYTFNDNVFATRNYRVGASGLTNQPVPRSRPRLRSVENKRLLRRVDRDLSWNGRPDPLELRVGDVGQ
jgi:hypothetical protein